MTAVTEARRLDGLPDADLVGLAQAGCREAFDPLYRRYAAEILRFAVGRAAAWGRGRDFADDVAADTWEMALSKIDHYRGLACNGSPVRAWLFGVAKHQVFRTASADWPEVAMADDDLQRVSDTTAAEHDGDDDEAGRQALRVRVYQAVAELRPTQRAVARLRLDGLDYGEIAERTGLTRRQVTDAWRKGRRHLQRALSAMLTDAATADDATVDGVAPDVVARVRALDQVAAANEVIDPAVDRERVALRARVDQAVAGLGSGMQRTVARLYLAGLGYAAIAERTGWTQMAVTNAWVQARRHLRTTLAATSAAVEAAPPDPLTRLRMLDEVAAAGQATDAQQRERAALRERVDRAVAELPPTKREVARLRLAGLSAAAVAEHIGGSYQTTTGYWYEAKRVLERALADTAVDTAPADTTQADPHTTPGADPRPAISVDAAGSDAQSPATSGHQPLDTPADQASTALRDQVRDQVTAVVRRSVAVVGGAGLTAVGAALHRACEAAAARGRGTQACEVAA